MFAGPHPPYDPTDRTSFSYETVVKRWPVIITAIIDQLYRENHKLSLQSQQPQYIDNLQLKDKLSEGKAIMEKISKLKYDMGRDHVMQPIGNDNEADINTYNVELKRLADNGKNTWFTAPWLYAECYLYRLLRSYFSTTRYWISFDPFLDLKQDMFKKSGTSIAHIATTMHELEVEKAILESDTDKIGVLFKEMIQICLWGNATDLSLLTHLSAADIQNLQTVGKEAQDARKEFILKDDQDAVWGHVKNLNHSKIDFILDNAGFELFTDLVFADFLVTFTPYVSRVVFHPKIIPWFVSDVTPYDFRETITSLLDPSFLSVPPSASVDHLTHMVTRWKRYLDDGTFSLSVPLDTPYGGAQGKLAEFWTTPWPYWDLQERDATLWSALRESELVIFKGDLNYRKLVGDIRWPASTPFASAIGPLAGSFPLLSLRTNKADVVVGVDQTLADKLDNSAEKWRTNGKYALISFLQRGALDKAHA